MATILVREMLTQPQITAKTNTLLDKMARSRRAASATDLLRSTTTITTTKVARETDRAVLVQVCLFFPFHVSRACHVSRGLLEFCQLSRFDDWASRFVAFDTNIVHCLMGPLRRVALPPSAAITTTSQFNLSPSDRRNESLPRKNEPH
jgi:hypothetical protein